jgi:hypothetical protein
MKPTEVFRSVSYLAVVWAIDGVKADDMPENRTAGAAVTDPGLRQVDEVVRRLAQRYAGSLTLHRDVIEAAVRSAWVRYDGARVTTFRAIVAERDATAALQEWFGPPTRPAQPPAPVVAPRRPAERRNDVLSRAGVIVAG